ncbi:MAG: SpoIIE family protein phosphatase [Flavobacteriales bacterium]|nr:SpoIIE family protein phosphatase [Flavobacteriales bacterium]
MEAAVRINWRAELDKTALKYHKITLWVAVVFNMLFFATDYINIYEYWEEFLIFRVIVSLICLFTVLFHKKLNISIQLMGVIPVLLISIQNAYMWSVMDAEHLQKHTLAYMALFIGSGMFVFYHVYYSIFIVAANIVANIFFLYFNSSLSVEEIMVSGGLLTLSVAIFSILLIRMRFKLTKKELVARFALEESKHELQEKNTEIVDSINYAKRIQSALIPPVEVFKKILPESFIIFKPKDIVSGDFYWISELNTTKENDSNEKLVVYAVADCTGHGVPGAFMSLIGLKIFNQSIKQPNINSPAEALDYLNNEVFNTVNKHSDSDNIIRDGMDVALCSINFKTLMLSFSGAKNPVYIVRNKELHEIKGDKQPIGSYAAQEPFINKEYQLEKGDMVYIFSDGFADQFGGPKGKKLKYKPFKEMLIANSDKSMDEQEKQLNNLFENWQGDLEQLDDVCVIGVRV